MTHTRSLPFHRSISLVLACTEKILSASPLATTPGRQRLGYVRQAHLIASSKKGVSEPRLIGKDMNDTGSGPLRSQENSLEIPER
jgi:hypothetical protein